MCNCGAHTQQTTRQLVTAHQPPDCRRSPAVGAQFSVGWTLDYRLPVTRLVKSQHTVTKAVIKTSIRIEAPQSSSSTSVIFRRATIIDHPNIKRPQPGLLKQRLDQRKQSRYSPLGDSVFPSKSGASVVDVILLQCYSWPPSVGIQNIVQHHHYYPEYCGTGQRSCAAVAPLRCSLHTRVIH